MYDVCNSGCNVKVSPNDVSPDVFSWIMGWMSCPSDEWYPGWSAPWMMSILWDQWSVIRIQDGVDIISVRPGWPQLVEIHVQVKMYIGLMLRDSSSVIRCLSEVTIRPWQSGSGHIDQGAFLRRTYCIIKGTLHPANDSSKVRGFKGRIIQGIHDTGRNFRGHTGRGKLPWHSVTCSAVFWWQMVQCEVRQLYK
jgi:hypothetical protein